MFLRDQSIPSASVQKSRSLLLEALRVSNDEGFGLGVKLVRGAYMDKERKLAEKEGRPDPVHRCWEDTNDRWENRKWSILTDKPTKISPVSSVRLCWCSYNGSLDVMLEAVSQKPERYRIIVATHNEDSVRRAARR